MATSQCNTLWFDIFIYFTIHFILLKVAPNFLFFNELNNFLLTEREGRTGEYWPEVVTVRTEHREVRTKSTEGQYSPVRLEQARLVSSLLYGTRLMLYIYIFFFFFSNALPVS